MSTVDPTDPRTVAHREAQAMARDVELSLAEAALAGREDVLQAARRALLDRALVLDERERVLHRAVQAADGTAGAEVAADPAAARVAQLEAERVARLAAREAWLAERQARLDAHRADLDALDAGLRHLAARLDARERRLTEAPHPAEAEGTPRARPHQTVLGIARPVAPPPQVQAAPLPTPQMRPAEVRHAQTTPMSLDEAESLDAPARPKPLGPQRRTRTVPAPPLQVPQTAPALPDDLPDAVPDAVHPRRQATESFVSTLTLGGQAVRRRQIEVDHAGARLLVAFSGAVPTLGPAPVLAFRAPGADEEHFPVELRRMLPAPEGGVVAVLATDAWDAPRREAFTRALQRLN